MRKKVSILLFFIVLLSFNFRSRAQFTPEDLADRGKWEEFLLNANIVKEEQIIDRKAVTKPWHLILEKDGITKEALWKNVEGKPFGYVDSWKYEIAAYLLDKYLELNMVPPTVEKRFQGNRGSCQLWVDYELTLNIKNEKNIKVTSLRILHWNRATYLHRAFDNLIGNEDRHANNILITKDWRMYLIDHSRSFRTGKKYTKELIYTAKHKEGPKLMSELPRAFVEKIKTLNFDLIKNIVGEYLTDEEINAVMARKELILQEIDRLIKEKGEDQVLY